MARVWVLAIAVWCAAAQEGAVDALNRGDFAGAEKTARAELRAHPDDALLWSALGAALDSQEKFADAETAHRRATALAPRSADIWNNYANHLGKSGNDQAARDTYLKVVALYAAHFNANVQLARMALKAKNGREALGYLDRLPANRPPVPLLRLEALYRAGDRAAADALAESLEAGARSDLALSFSTGVALANAEEFGAAERFFSNALALAPSDFNILFNLGVVALRAGHAERAREVLEAALRQQPRSVDVMYHLALAERELQHGEAAVQWLVQAGRLDPARADVQKLLALAATDLAALADAAAAWDRYIALRPDDQAARRERAFIAVEMGETERGMPELRRFVTRYPDDPDGHYELAMALAKEDAAQAVEQLGKALALRKDFAAARAARGNLYYQMGKPEAALPDLEAAVELRPGDAETLDRLGQAYGALERASDAVRVLRRAAELAPTDSKVQLHLARALSDVGEADASKAAMERFRAMPPAPNKAVPAGLVDYLGMTPEQRRADYRARVEKAVREHPDDAAAQAAYLRMLLDEGKVKDATEALWRLPPSNAAELQVARFDVLAASGARAETDAAMERALRAAPGDSGLLRRAAAYLVRTDRAAEALRRLDAARAEDRETLLARALVLELAGRQEEWMRAIEDIRKRWPEWYAVAVVQQLAQQNQRSALIDLLGKDPRNW